MDILPLVIQLASGGVGGIAAGKLIPKASLGTAGKVISGIVGGGLGGQLLGLLGLGGDGAAGSLDLSSIISSVAGGGVGGGVLMTIIGSIKGMMKK